MSQIYLIQYQAQVFAENVACMTDLDFRNRRAKPGKVVSVQVTQKILTSNKSWAERNMNEKLKRFA